MNFATWDTLFNLLLLVLWLRFWTRNDRRAGYNPYLDMVIRSSDLLLVPMRNALGLRDMRIVLLICAFFLMAARAMLLINDPAWNLHIGLEQLKPNTGSLPPAFLLSLLSYAFFLFNIWALSLIYCRGTQMQTGSHPVEALHVAARPFSLLPAQWRPVALLVCGVLLGGILHMFPSAIAQTGPAGLSSAGRDIPRLMISAMLEWTFVLRTLLNILFIFIILSWIATFSGSMNLMMFCRDWIDSIIGPMRHQRFRIGMIDLTAIVFFLVVGFVQTLLSGILINTYRSFL